MPDNKHPDAEGASVEFVFRVHADGRRERFARVYVLDESGRREPGPRRPEGALARFVADAIAEASELRPSNRRRVAIDARDELARQREGRVRRVTRR